MCSGKENPDSDADLDVDGDDTLEYGKPQYPWGTAGQGGAGGTGRKRIESSQHRWYLLMPSAPRRGQCQSFNQDSAFTAYCKLGSVVLDHHARYTEADVIPCTGEEPGEAKEREALRGAVLKQVWAQAWVGGVEGWEVLRQGQLSTHPQGSPA